MIRLTLCRHAVGPAGDASRGRKMPTGGTVPGFMEPIYRFKTGEGELELRADARVFNVWEAMALFDDDAFPLVIDGDEIQLGELLFEAAKIIAADPERPGRIARSEHVDRVIERCKAAGVDPDLLG